ncbi:MAG: glycine--tRNA ligase subunit beta [Synergistaceae bacterium]|nr:glycine--tRNA ligase subunit beta [Synergistaceae bacterium]
MAEILFEIGTEEIPARFMKQTLSEIEATSKEKFAEARIVYKDLTVRSTPRRLVLQVHGVSATTEAAKEVFKGPAAKAAYDESGNFSRAAIGFAKSKGLEAADLKIADIAGGQYLVAEVVKDGQAVEGLLPAILKELAVSLSFPKNMYWKEKTTKFARPVRWLVALFDDHIIPFEFAGLATSRFSRGHRFMGSKNVQLDFATDYDRKMKENFVITDPAERAKMILSGVADIEKKLGARVSVDPDLLHENVHLNEYPVPFLGTFDKEFLTIPQEVSILSMATNQKYFPVTDDKGKLMPYFVGVSNNIAKDMSVVQDGNERVLRARLYDALFFWDEDAKRSLDEMAESLKKVTYQQQLGSLYDKVQRVKKIALFLAEQLNLNISGDILSRACDLSKADLVSNMVYEFSDVQGVMGREYARRAGEKEEVALALYEQYLPKQAGGELPTQIYGALLGLAERFDTLVSIYKIGAEPTSQADPYGLRRAARTINELVWGLNLDVNLTEVFDFASDLLHLEGDRLDKLVLFIKQRTQIQLKERGLVQSSITLASETQAMKPLQFLKMASVFTKNANDKWFEDLITAAVRVRNIVLKQSVLSDVVDEGVFVLDEEKKLFGELKNADMSADKAIVLCDWETLAKIMSEMSPVITDFFDKVLVMDKDEAIKQNRLALLKACDSFFGKIGNFSLLKQN